MFKQMFKNFRKNFSNKNYASSLFNFYCNPTQKTSSEEDDFTDITSESIIKEKNNNNNNSQNELINEFNKSIIRIILDSRKGKNNDFSMNTSKISNDSNSDDKSFNPEIDDLFIYDDFFQEKNELQKFVIEFYLIKIKGNIKIEELVEKWKFCYKLYDKSSTINDISIIKNKMSIYIKSIISYSRLLPLYQYNLSNDDDNNNNIIEFKFYQNNSIKKGKFSKRPSGNITLKNPNLFSFKLNIKYYTDKELKHCLENKEYDIDINIQNKFNSISFNKKKGNVVGIESISRNSYDNNPINNLNLITNDEQHNIKTCETEIDKNKINDILPESDDSSFCLIFDSEEEKKNIKHKDNLKESDSVNKRKYSNLSNGYETTEDCSPRNSTQININNLRENNEKIISPFSSRKSCIKTENKNINNILKEYSALKNMIEYLNCPITIRSDKLFEYT